MSANDTVVRPEAPPSFAHLRRLTDDTGLLEHALGRIPRRREGYTTDDNARALWTVTEWLSFGPDAVSSEDRNELNRLADIYIAFMLWTQNDDGWWLNNFSYDRTLEPEGISHDCQGRSIWSCADAWIRLEGPHRETARVIIEKSMPTLYRIDSLRGQAFAMAACAHLLEASQKGQIDLPADMARELNYHLLRLESLLNGAFRHFFDDNWRWFEPAMTYSNGVLPWAMLRTYRFTRRAESLRTGLESLAYLLEVMTTEEGWLRPIGNEGWCTSETVSRWDQQPLEMFKLALALEEAALAIEISEAEADLSARLVGSARGKGGYDSRSEDNHALVQHGAVGVSGLSSGNNVKYRAVRDRCLAWYYGDNDLQVTVVDPNDGSCCDGLTQYGPNINCGAEATISYLMTEALCRRG
ncbi:hypothetical protein [Cohnella silvisoli]|uniref:Glycosyl hydrolase n=1 Tax=Cohnella silvisoli TaxID=2873699 RepID=A0ABV1L2R8_9BACL|nr:hypothetical protein [Cohnella silvisoli]MCD9025969.1 hypothetical protein [Cohnella silvisoli]